MSTPPKSDAKVAAKRRALARRRNREIARHIFAYGIIAILVLGTISTVLVQTVGTSGTSQGTVAVPTVTVGASNGFDQLLTQADQYVAASQWVSATGLYKAYLSQYPTRADVSLKLGKAIVSSPSPNYVEASQYLQQAVTDAGQDTATGSAAQTLLTQIQPNVATAIAIATATGPITSTTTITSTTQPLATTGTSPTTSGPGTPSGPIGPVVVTGTNTISPSPGKITTP